MKKILLTCALASASVLAATAYDGDTSEWMKHIPGSTFACQVTIPGSHDSATGEGWAIGSTLGSSYSQAQDVKIDDQLARGARGFDIRPNWSSNKWVCAHGMHNTKLSLTDCFNKFVSFLDANPSEFIVIHIFHGGSSDWSDSNKADFPKFLEGYKDRLINFRRDLTVDELRGKILIFSRENYNGDPYGAKFNESLRQDYGWGSWIDWDRQTNITASGIIESNLSQGRVYYQDLAATYEDGKQQEKLDGIRRLLDFSTAYRPTNPETCIWYFNFASGYNQVTSLFGNNISKSDGYRGNATYTNPCFIDYLKANPGPAGVVLADYICTDNSGSYNTRGAELIDVLIDNNFRYLDWVENGVGQATPYSPSADSGAQASWTIDNASTKFHGTQRSAAVMADFSGNGKLDIISGGGNDHVKLLINNGNWDIVELHNQPNGVVQNNYPHYCTLDFNNDGKVDLLVSGVSDHSANYVSHNVPYAKITSWTENNSPKEGYAMTALYENLGDNTFRLVEKTGLPVIAAWHGKNNVGQTSQPIPFAVGDFDHDGYVDIAVTGIVIAAGEKATAALYRNQCNGTFAKYASFKPVIGNVHFADLNNDGWLDLVFDGQQNEQNDALNSAGSNGRIYLNNEGNGFIDVTSDKVRFYTTRAGGSVLADFNKDGYLDLFTMGWGDNGINYAGLLNYNNHGTNGKGDVFITPDRLVDAYGLNGAEQLRILARDVNTDGILDIIYDGAHDNTVYYGSEAMKFTRGNAMGCRGGGGDDSASAFGDVNGNGLIDRYQTGWQWYDDETGGKRHGQGGWNWEASLYGNTSSFAAPDLDKPANVKAILTEDYITVTWNDIDDITAGYNVVIWDEASGTVVSNIPVNPSFEKLTVADGKEAAIRPGVGRYTVKTPAVKDRALPAFKVGVQAVSLYHEKNSPITWAVEASGVENVNGHTDAVEVTVADNSVMVKASADCDVRIIDLLGRTVAAGKANFPITLASKGIYMVTTPTSSVKIKK